MRRTPVLALLVVLPVLAFVAGCGASGGDDSADTKDKTTTTAAADDDATTTAPDDGDGTTTTADGSDPGSGPTPEALADILPTADDIGPGYTMSQEDLSGTDSGDDESSSDDDSSSDDEADPTEQAIIDACPGAEILNELDSGDANPDEVSREFENDAQATVEVALDPTPDDFTEDTVDTVVEALADCGTIKTEDEDGNAIEMTIKAERNDDHGDFGVQMSMEATFDFMGTPLEIDFQGLIFSVDGVTVSVVATSGLDETTFESVPGDYDLVPGLADEMADRVSSL